jgi:hydroxymethylpyrimidine/phosphomethylpyrimidine kinase
VTPQGGDATAAGEVQIGMDGMSAVPSAQVTDVLYCKATGATILWHSPRVPTVNLHGTGCTLSASIAACLARAACLEVAVGQSQDDITVAAVDAARRYLQLCLRGSARIKLGKGKSGPFNHGVAVDDWEGGEEVWAAAARDSILMV